jgi:Biopolymer transport protein
VKFRRKPRETVDINLASLIDVVFILLLFFVVTTTFTRETQLRVDLPEAVSGSPNDEQNGKQLDIAISADGVFSLNNQLLPKNDLASLMDALQKSPAAILACPCPSAPMAKRNIRRSSPRWTQPANWASRICA